ncbi:MAG: VWA domain-containing protein [Gemmatimonadota bacterium]
MKLSTDKRTRILKALRRPASDQSGAVLVMVAASLVILLGVAGLALDSARGFVRQARMSKAIDAAVLTGAKTLRSGESQARQQALAVAAANGFPDGVNGVNLDLQFGTNALGEQTVSMSGLQPMPTLLVKLVGPNSMNVAAAATATIPPVDLTLVLDQSGSLGQMGAWDDLQDAAWSFVQNFDDNLDQVSLVSFQIGGTLRVPLQGGFTNPVRNAIYFSGMKSAGYTNPGEGLRLAYEQMTGPDIQARSAKAVVFFTDGRPTAFRGQISGDDRFLAVPWATSNRLVGYWDDPVEHPADSYTSPDGCQNWSSCYGWTEQSGRAQALQEGLDRANDLRNSGVIIYTVGLGNPFESDPMKVPDMDYLSQIANVGGVVDSKQQIGKAYFAPSAAQLKSVFEQVAQDLLVRLSD